MQYHFETFHHPVFLENMEAHIKEHLSDASLDVKNWTNLMTMSRSNLHRKLKQTVDMSITEYVRYIRLHHAISILTKEKEWTIYQVALEVGFNSQSYFTSRFKELFGTTPAKYRKNIQNGDIRDKGWDICDKCDEGDC